MLRRPTLADVKAITLLANDRASRKYAAAASYLQTIRGIVRAMANDHRATAFLIENNHVPIASSHRLAEPEAPELGYWLGVEHWARFAPKRRGQRSISPSRSSTSST